jgi:MFS family permease
MLQFGLARVGVGIGEASASPAAISLLCDYFPKRMRATILALYYTGIYVGAGASLIIGGFILANWDGQFGLRGWQAAFILCGLPGLLLAALVMLTIREPARRHVMEQRSSLLGPFGSVLKEAAAIIPPWSIFSLISLRASRKAVLTNLAVLCLTIIGIWLITASTDRLLSPARRGTVGEVGSLTITANLIQWLAMGISFYGFFSWVQALKLRNPVAYKFVIKAPAFVGILCCSGLLSLFLYGIGAFVFLYGSRYLGFSPSMGATMGLIAALGGGFGMFFGGMAADRFKRRHPAGRLYFTTVMISAFGIFTWIQFSAASPTVFLVSYLLALLTLTGWNPVIAATAQDLVPANLRGTAAATTALTSSIVGLGLGPYLVGFVSDVTGDLRLAILSTLWVLPLALICLIFSARCLPAAEQAVMRHMAEG